MTITDRPEPGRETGADVAPFDLEKALGQSVERLPLVLRLFAEDAAAHAGTPEGAASLRAIRTRCAGGPGTGRGELAVHPRRVLMHDTTAVPALVDIAALRDAVARAGGDPAALAPAIPVDVVIDHSVSLDHHAGSGALELNRRIEIRRNRERYRFLKWAGRALPGLRVLPPGRGILHTLNLEDIATVASPDAAFGGRIRPDTMIGTDSHTPMAGALGMLACGVGGLEAEMAMFGVPLTLGFPLTCGVRLTGRPGPGITATDIALAVTERLRQAGVAGQFVEFHGPGIAALTLGARAAIANMAPEYGARSGLFPVDGETLRHLRRSGRSAAQIGRVEAWACIQGFWHEPEAPLAHDLALEIDLGALGTAFAGPHRPDERRAPTALAAWGRAQPGPRGGLPRAPVVIAAITSCTNSADPALILGAGLVARKARALGLAPPPWVKTSFAPGSRAAQGWLERAGLDGDMAALGFGLSAIGCTTCIGNSGPLTGAALEGIAAGACPVALLSGNRNFPRRVHSAIEDAFLCAPPMVVVLALAGRVDLDPSSDVLARSADGRDVRLADLWPSEAEIDAALARIGADLKAATDDGDWDRIEAPEGPLFPWDPGSTALRPPPFFERTGLAERLMLRPLAVFGDGMTTDHISPAGEIPSGSPAAEWLRAQGVKRPNVFAAYRGNWEVMLRGAFSHPQAAERLFRAEAGGPGAAPRESLIVAGERYGAGSSRDWAAKAPALLGVRAVLACSIEPIHRQNLIGMGILPLALPPGTVPSALGLSAASLVEIDTSGLAPAKEVIVVLTHADAPPRELRARALIETDRELVVLRAGGILPFLRARTRRAPAARSVRARAAT